MNSATTSLNMTLSNDQGLHDMIYGLVKTQWQETHSATLVGDALQEWVEEYIEGEEARRSSFLYGTLAQIGLSEIEWDGLAKNWIGRIAEQEYYTKHQRSIYDSEETGVQ